MDSPTPVPLMFASIAARPRTNLREDASAVRIVECPTPRSTTLIAARSWSLRHRTHTVGSPGEYLMALSMRLRSASDSALSSARNRTPASGPVDLDRFAGLARLRFDVVDDTSRTRAAASTIDEAIALGARFHSAEVEQRLDQPLQPRRLARENPVVLVPPFLGRDAVRLEHLRHLPDGR